MNRLKILCITLQDKISDKILNHFPFCQIAPGVDLRNAPPLQLYNDGHITLSTLDTLVQGRTSHKEISSTGAVGLYLANVNAFALHNDHLLILEEDCMFTKDPTDEIDTLLRNVSEFDVAIFGAQTNASSLRPVAFMPAGWYHWEPGKGLRLTQTHCVFYSKNGKHIVHQCFQEPLEVHIDSWIRILADIGKIRLIVQINNHTAIQDPSHKSTLDHDILPEDFYKVLCCVIMLLWILTIILYAQWSTYTYEHMG